MQQLDILKSYPLDTSTLVFVAYKPIIAADSVFNFFLRAIKAPPQSQKTLPILSVSIISLPQLITPIITNTMPTTNEILRYRSV